MSTKVAPVQFLGLEKAVSEEISRLSTPYYRGVEAFDANHCLEAAKRLASEVGMKGALVAIETGLENIGHSLAIPQTVARMFELHQHLPEDFAFAAGLPDSRIALDFSSRTQSALRTIGSDATLSAAQVISAYSCLTQLEHHRLLIPTSICPAVLNNLPQEPSVTLAAVVSDPELERVPNFDKASQKLLKELAKFNSSSAVEAEGLKVSRIQQEASIDPEVREMQSSRGARIYSLAEAFKNYKNN